MSASDQDPQQALEKLRTEYDRQRRATESGGLGIWEWDIDADRITWSDSIYPMHGLQKGQFGGHVADSCPAPILPRAPAPSPP